MSKANEVAEGRIVAIILAGKWVKGRGHEVFFAREGEQGYCLSDDPWYWGDPGDEARSFKAAQATADEYNEKRGISKDDALLIVTASMRDSVRNQALVSKERDKMDKAVPEYAGCVPYRILFSLFDYVITGQDPGEFVEAVLCNKLNQALMLADDSWTLDQIKALTKYVFNCKQIPDACWGSQEKVDAWKKAGGKVGKGWLSL